MSCFVDFLRCILCCEEDGFIEERDYSRYEVLSQRSSSPPPRYYNERRRSPPPPAAAPSIQPRYSYETNHSNQTPIVSFREESASKSRPKQPETAPTRFATQTLSPLASSASADPPKKPRGSSVPSNLRQTSELPVYYISRDIMDDIMNEIEKGAIPSPKLSAPSPLESAAAKKPIRSSGLDLPKKPPASQKPSAPSGLDPPRKPSTSAPSGSDPGPPKKPNASTPSGGSDPPKKPSNWRPPVAVIPSVYHIPKDIKRIIEKDQVPEVLKKRLSPSNYADYFAALLYAEDYYMEKWQEFLKEFKLSGVALRLREEAKSRKVDKAFYMDRRDMLESSEGERKLYVEFDMDLIPERRPFLLAKDYVYVRRSGKEVKPFQGFLSRVEKSKLLLAEFGKDFHAQHSLMNKYDVWFDFNRVCLKRSHQGVEAAVDPSFQGILFPERVSRSRRQIPTFTIPFNRNLSQEERSAVYQILTLNGPPPYLIVQSSSLRIQEVITAAILQIYRTFRESRILIVAPQNNTCDSLMMHLKKEIPGSEVFRANAAFRERDDVPESVLSSSSYEGKCFTCPPLEDLKKFKVTASTFMSSFRLHSHGIHAGHYSHIFVVDACYATEPETMVTLANLANESTAVVLTGSYQHYAKWVRADISRANGLRRSYFKRLLESEPYSSRDPGFVMYL